MRKTILTLLCLAVFALAGAASAYGQGSANSSLGGTIHDQSGAVIPGADVLVKNDATSREYRAVSADNGTFTVPLLPAGTYTVTVSAPRFKQAVYREVKVYAATPANLQVILQVGGTSEVVTVEAGAAIVQSQSANIATTLEVRQIS